MRDKSRSVEEILNERLENHMRTSDVMYQIITRSEKEPNLFAIFPRDKYSRFSAWSEVHERDRGQLWRKAHTATHWCWYGYTGERTDRYKNGEKLEFLCDESRHLICLPYSIENLHRMARHLNIKRCWFHAGRRPHYDIPKMRVDEIKAQCRIVSSEEIVTIIREHLEK